MQRAKVCVRLVSVSGKSHMRLVKGKDALPEIADHEAAYRDNTGEQSASRPVRSRRLLPPSRPPRMHSLGLAASCCQGLLIAAMCAEGGRGGGLLLSQEKPSGAFCL